MAAHMHLTNTAPGRANAVSWLLFVVITIIVAVMFKLTGAFSKEDSQ